MTITQRATGLYSVQDGEFKEELLRLLNIMADEITDLRGEVRSLERRIDDHNIDKHYKD